MPASAPTRRLKVAIIALAVITSVLTANGPTRAIAAKAPNVCGAMVWDVAPLNPVAEETASEWAVSLMANPTSDEGGVASGTVSLVSESERYDVPFEKFATPLKRDAGEEVPLVVRFRDPVRLVLGYVASLDGPDGGPCYHISAFVADTYVGKSLLTLHARTQNAPVVDAPEGIPDPPLPKCSDPGRVIAKARQVAQVSNMQTVAAGQLDSIVVIALTDEGIPYFVSPYKESGNATADNATRDAALATTYEPGHFHCRPYGGTYTFRGTYNASP